MFLSRCWSWKLGYCTRSASELHPALFLLFLLRQGLDKFAQAGLELGILLLHPPE